MKAGTGDVYLNLINPAAEFEFNPLAREDMWERFNQKHPRKLRMKLASPSDFESIGGPEESIGKGIANIGEAVHAPYITIEVSMGRMRGSLAEDRTKGLIKKIMTFGQKNPGKVQALSVSMSDEDGMDVIDFLDEHLVEKDYLELNDLSPEKNYISRANFLETMMLKNWRYINDKYGS